MQKLFGRDEEGEENTAKAFGMNLFRVHSHWCCFLGFQQTLVFICHIKLHVTHNCKYTDRNYN